MKTVNDLNNNKAPIVRIDSSLEKYQKKILFPKKLEKANQMLKTARLPKKRSHTKT